MGTPDLANQVATIEELLRSVAKLVRKRGREILSQFDLTPPQLDALLAVAGEDGITMGELCQRMYLACSTVTDLVDRMERGGLVARERDPHDRRVVRLRVLPRGYQVLEAVLEERRRYLAGVLARLDEGELERLAASLRRVYHLMSEET